MWRKLVQLLTDSLAYGLGSVLSKIIGFLLIPLYTRYLLPGEYGVLAMLGVLSMTFQAIAYLGLKSAVFRQFSLDSDGDEKAHTFVSGLWVVLASTAALTLLAEYGAATLAELLIGDSSHLPLVRLSLVSSALATVGGVPLLVLQADRRAKTVAGLNLGLFFLSTVITIYLVVGLELGAAGVVWGRLIGNGALLPLQLLLARDYLHHRPSITRTRQLLRYGLPFVPYRLQIVAVAVFGELMVRHLLGLSEAGIYSVALRFALPLGFVVGAVNQAWWAYKFKIFREEDTPQAFFRSIVTYYLVVVSSLWVGLSIWGPELVRLLTPVAYHRAAWIVPAAALVPLCQGLYQMLGTGIELGDEARSIPWVGSAGLVTSIAATLYLVPRLGALGAALATALAALAMTVTIYVQAQRRFEVAYDWPRLLGVASWASLAVIATVSARSLPNLERWTIGGAISMAFPLLVLGTLWTSAVDRQRLLAGGAGIWQRRWRRQSSSSEHSE